VSRGRGRSPTTAAHCSDVRYPSGLLFWADLHRRPPPPPPPPALGGGAPQAGFFLRPGGVLPDPTQRASGTPARRCTHNGGKKFDEKQRKCKKGYNAGESRQAPSPETILPNSLNLTLSFKMLLFRCPGQRALNRPAECHAANSTIPSRHFRFGYLKFFSKSP